MADEMMLPNARHLATIQGFFAGAAFNKDGTATLRFQIPPEEKHKLLDISTNDGMALNIDVHETKMPEGEDWLAAALGLDAPTDDDEDEKPVVVKKVKRA